ncbi:MAG TPA: flagellin [Acetobacteraceae bacterium]|nr:flagellin [Acetobacteraceae bacterium]
MALDSIITNIDANIALQSLSNTQNQLAVTQKQISTGYAVADATDNGAAYAIAQRVRGDVGALTSANQQLGNVQGLLGVTNSALNDVSNLMNSARDVLVKLADGNTQGTQRTQYVTQYQSLVANIKSDIQNADYNGKTLIGNISGSVGTIGAVNVVTNEVGSTYNIGTFSGSKLYASINFQATTQLGNATTVAGLISNGTGATFMNKFNALATQMNTYGSATNFVTNQINYNSDKITSLNDGLGALVDANLAQESAKLQALQIQQQLGTQALSIANQAPSSLLSLFR